jgi:hypothetical protein
MWSYDPGTFDFSGYDLSSEDKAAVVDSYRNAGYLPDEIQKFVQEFREEEVYVPEISEQVRDSFLGNGDYEFGNYIPLIVAETSNQNHLKDLGSSLLTCRDDKLSEWWMMSQPLWKSDVDEEKVYQDLKGNLNDYWAFMSEYISLVDEISRRDEFKKFYSDLDEKIEKEILESEHIARALANTPPEKVPETLEPVEDIYGIESERVFTRRRNMHNLEGCDLLEPRHRKTLLDEDPSGNTILVSIDDEIVGAWKEKGTPSLLGLRNVQNTDGSYPLLKGWAYEGNTRLWSNKSPRKVYNWKIMDLEYLPLSPMRKAGEKVGRSHEWFKKAIDERLQSLEEDLSDTRYSFT